MEVSHTMIKEHLNGLQFIKHDVLHSPQQRAIRKYQLRRAMLLGNLYHTKVGINFRDHQNTLLKVETTIWAVGEQYLSLKGGRTIPIWAIEKIEF
jgi:hypothetical protein